MKGPRRPQFHTIYTYPVEYMDYLEAGVDKSRKVPSALNIEFRIPLVEEFREIKSLDVSEDKILLDIGEKYFIDVTFEELRSKYKLVHSESKAKFDKKKRSLRISIPVDKSATKSEALSVEGPTESTTEAEQEQKQEEVLEENTWQDSKKLLEISEGNVAVEYFDK